MRSITHQSAGRELWALVSRQHGVLSAAQLRAFGMARRVIDRRLASGRLHRVHRGVFAVGRPDLTQRGRWMAAVLACGEGAVLSHGSAGALWGLLPARQAVIEVVVPAGRDARPAGVTVHRSAALRPEHCTERDAIPVTDVVRTLVDLAARLPPSELERAVNEGDRLELIDPERLRSRLIRHRGRRGVAILRALLDRQTFTLTDSELERRFLPLARRAGLPPPLTQQQLNGFRVDFYWPRLRLVVETDGLRYHRTAAQQARDRRRDQAHVATGLIPVRFTHAQIAYEEHDVVATLRAVAAQAHGRLGA